MCVCTAYVCVCTDYIIEIHFLFITKKKKKTLMSRA